MKTTVYNEICRTLNKVRDIRREYTNYGYSDELRATADILIACEESLEAEARKYCSDTKVIDV